MSSIDTSQYVFMAAVIVSLIPAFSAILGGWMQSSSATLQRRGSIAMLITIIALGVTLLVSAIGRAIEGSYLIAGALGLGVVLMALAGTMSRTNLQIVSHRVATGESLDLTTEQRRRYQLLGWAMTALCVVIIALIITNVVLGVVGVLDAD